MCYLVTLVLILLSQAVHANLDRALQAFETGNYTHAIQQANAALSLNLAEDDQLLARELVLLSRHYDGQQGAHLRDAMAALDAELVAYYSADALVRIELLGALSEQQYLLGDIEASSSSAALVVRIASADPDNQSNYFAALYNLAQNTPLIADSSNAVLFPALYDFISTDWLPREDPTLMEAVALMAIALFQDGQPVRAFERYTRYTQEEWLAYASSGAHASTLVDDLSYLADEVDVENLQILMNKIQAEREQLRTLDRMFGEVMALEAENLARTERLTQLSAAGQHDEWEADVKNGNFNIHQATFEKMNRYLAATYPDDPAIFTFSTAILQLKLNQGDIAAARPYLQTLLALPSAYIVAAEIPIGVLTATFLRRGGLADDLAAALVAKAVEADSIFPNADPTVLFDLIRGQTQQKFADKSWNQALDLSMQAVALAERHGLRELPRALDDTATSLFELGRFADAVDVRQKMLNAAGMLHDEAGLSAALGGLAMATLKLGRYKEAQGFAARKLTLEEQRTPPLSEELNRARMISLMVSLWANQALTAEDYPLVQEVLSTYTATDAEDQLLEAVVTQLDITPQNMETHPLFTGANKHTTPLILSLLAEYALLKADIELASHWTTLGLNTLSLGEQSNQQMTAFFRLMQVRGMTEVRNGNVAAGLSTYRKISDQVLRTDVSDHTHALDHVPFHISAAVSLANSTDLHSNNSFQNEAFMMAQVGTTTAVGRALNAAVAKRAASKSTYPELMKHGGNIANPTAKVTPGLSAITAEHAISLAAVTELLSDEEVMVLYTTSDTIDPVTGRPASFAMALSNERILITHIPARTDIQLITDKFRCSVAISDPNCSNATKGTRGFFQPIDAVARNPVFDSRPAHNTYNTLLAPVEDILSGKSRLIIVPDQALVATPFHLLVSDNGAARRPLDEINWLVHDMSVEISPSVLSFYASRTMVGKQHSEQAFLGIGDPLIGTQKNGPHLTDCNSSPKRTALLADATRNLQRAGGGTTAIANLSALPDARCELEAIATRFSRSELAIHANATESKIKKWSAEGRLKKFSVLSFATHGLVAGEIGVNDAGLVLTPPRVATSVDDGLLTSSEIANLDLDAALVILSACNTSSGHSANQEGLSGLASAFFAAGARSLVVSHWPVYSDAAVTLTSKMIDALDSDPTMTRANALRFAMLSILNEPGATPRQRHPGYWGAFMIAGDGLGL